MAIVVKKSPGDSDDKLIKDFLKKTMAEGIVLELKGRQRYEKPSAQRHRRKSELKRGKGSR